MTKIAVINVRIDAEIKRQIERLAASDDRSLSSYVQHILRNHIAEARKRKATE